MAKQLNVIAGRESPKFMIPQTNIYKIKKMALIPLAVLLALASVVVAQQKDATSITPLSSVNQQLQRKLSLAKDYHDLADLCIKNGELSEAVASERQILQLRLPAEYEKLVVESVSIIAEKLAEARAFDLGQSLIDETLKSIQQDANRASLLKSKARLFLLAGDNEKALESLRKAMDIESKLKQ
jgi:tetratricopeptide (TPR) repeat protein